MDSLASFLDSLLNGPFGVLFVIMMTVFTLSFAGFVLYIHILNKKGK